MEDWVKIIEIPELIQANVINAALHAQNIDTAFINRKDSAYVFLGRYDIYVKKIDEANAIKIVQDIRDRDQVAED